MSTSTDRCCLACCLSALSVLLDLSAPVLGDSPRKDPPDVTAALACIMKSHNSILDSVLPKHSPISFKYTHGDIPGTSPEGRTNALSVFVYAKAKGRAILMTAILRDGRWDVLDDYYLLARTNKSWNVIDGNGGQATYAAIAKLANDREMAPMHSIRRDQLRAGNQCASY
jgi:hypothetical protein